MFILLLTLIIIRSVLLYMNVNVKQQLIPHFIQFTDYFVIFHAAICEEIIFRILPSLFLNDYWLIRVFISVFIFSFVHLIPFFKKYNKDFLLDNLLCLINISIFGLYLMILEQYILYKIWWYILLITLFHYIF